MGVETRVAVKSLRLEHSPSDGRRCSVDPEIERTQPVASLRCTTGRPLAPEGRSPSAVEPEPDECADSHVG